MYKQLFFDLETTGLSTWRDRIVEIGILYQGKQKKIRFNPTIRIPEGASRVHNIFDKDVVDCPKFDEFADIIFRLFCDADCWIGYNLNKYDLPLLQTELLRVNSKYVLPNRPIIDVYELINSLFGSKKLKDIYLVLSGEKLEGAHDSIQDILATQKLYEIINSRFLK